MISFLLKYLAACPCGHSRLPGFLCCVTPFFSRRIPRYITIVPSFLPATQCNSLVKHLQSQDCKALGVMDVAQSSSNSIAIKKSKGRLSTALDATGIMEQLDTMMMKVCKEVIPDRYAGTVEWYERPMVLSYNAGGRFSKHADSEQLNHESGDWSRVLDRDVSAIVYLNDDFKGGQLRFHFFAFTYTPRAGDLVLFPSDHRYVHEARKVTAGHRMAVVSWVAQTGTPRVREQPPEHSRRL